MITADRPHQYPLHLQPADVDQVLKEKRRLSFLAYEKAIASGDRELIEATRKRFLDASAPFARWRQAKR